MHHHISTQSASDVEPIAIDGSVWLAIATGMCVCTRADVILICTVYTLTGSMGVSLFQWSSNMELFVFNSNLSSANAIRVESIPGTGNIY